MHSVLYFDLGRDDPLALGQPYDLGIRHLHDVEVLSRGVDSEICTRQSRDLRRYHHCGVMEELVRVVSNFLR